MLVTVCPSCGREVPYESRYGRPRTYCGVPCRRAAEHRQRQLRRRAAWAAVWAQLAPAIENTEKEEQE